MPGVVVANQPTVLAAGVLSTVNSSTTTLGSGATFTGTGEEVLNYADAHVFVWADQASATDGLQLEYSTDNVNWDDSDKYTISASSAKHIVVPTEARYFRVRYTNGGTAQGAFRLQTIYKYFRSKPSSHSLREPSMSEENDAELVKAVIVGKKGDGTYVSASFDDSGRLVVAPQSGASSVAGFVFGDKTTASTSQTDCRRTAYTEQTSNAQRSLVSASANDSSAGTGVRKVKITYYTSAGVGPSTETVTMNGTTAVNTVATDICYIEKLEATEVGSGGVAAAIISLKASTGGGGATVWSIASGDVQTFAAHHYVPTGKTCNITSQWGGHNGTTVGSGGTFIIKALAIGVSNAVEQQVSDSFRLYGQSSSVQRNYGTPIKVVGPARVLTYIIPETSTSINYRASFDFFDE